MLAKHTHSHRPTKSPKHEWQEKPISMVPLKVQAALREAMRIESIPASDYNDLLWIMTQESTGVVNARNPLSTARGLFQLLRQQYTLNPKGEASFGNAIEECQGGIHYIYGRYYSAHKAKEFWLRHHWY